MTLNDAQDHMGFEYCSGSQLYSQGFHSPSDSGPVMLILYLCMFSFERPMLILFIACNGF